jgi:hypothetical protein
LSQGEGEIFGINIADLTKEEKILLESLLVADNAGTFEWADKLAQDFGASREELNNLVYESLNTQLNTINESIDNFISEIENVSSKNKSGFSMEEAKKYSSLIGKDLWDTFKIENGLIVLNDLNDYIDEYYANLQNKNLELIE